MTWDELKRELLLGLKKLPSIEAQHRVGALEAVEIILQLKSPEYIKYPTQMFSRVPREQFMKNYPKKLTATEKAVANMIYDIIEPEK